MPTPENKKWSSPNWVEGVSPAEPQGVDATEVGSPAAKVENTHGANSGKIDSQEMDSL